MTEPNGTKDYSYLDKYIPYAQEVLRLTMNMEDDLDAVVGIDLSLYNTDDSEWVKVHYDGEKFVIYNEEGTVREKVFCRSYD